MVRKEKKDSNTKLTGKLHCIQGTGSLHASYIVVDKTLTSIQQRHTHERTHSRLSYKVGAGFGVVTTQTCTYIRPRLLELGSYGWTVGRR